MKSIETRWKLGEKKKRSSLGYEKYKNEMKIGGEKKEGGGKGAGNGFGSIICNTTCFRVGT